MATQTQFDWLAYGIHVSWAQYAQETRGTQNEQIYKDELAKQPRFEDEGHPELTLVYVGFEDDRWEEGKVALCLYLFDEQTGRGDFYTLSLSDSLVQDRNNTGVRKTAYQNTVEKLAKLGFTGGDNFEQFAAEFWGKKIPCWVTSKTAKQSGKLYYYIAAIGSSGQARTVMPWNIVRPQNPQATYQVPNAQAAQGYQPPAPQQAYQAPAPQQAPVYQQPVQQPMPQQGYQPPQAPVYQQPPQQAQQGPIPGANPFA